MTIRVTKGIYSVGGVAFILMMLAADLTAISIPDNSSVRRELFDVLVSPVSSISREDRGVFPTRGLQRSVKFDIEEQNEQLYLLFINEQNGRYPVVGSGNVIIRRQVSNGIIDQMKIYLDDIGALVLRISPAGRRSLLSLALFDDELYRRVPVGVPMEQLLDMNIEQILALTEGRIPWDDLFPPNESGRYDNLLNVLSSMREALPGLPDAEDGAMDENGNLVFIESLKINDLPGFNCSGFAKYVCDGVYAAHSGGRYLGIDRLKTKHPELRGSDLSLDFDDVRDPYFGLDWTRNLAVALAEARGDTLLNAESRDVRNIPWYRYTEDIGYMVENIIPVMYLQAIQEPGNFYLGSVNGEFGSQPVLRQHYHVVVLFPYFDEFGSFRIAVLERNVESSVASLQRRYAGEFIHLVGVTPATNFILQEIRYQR